jgi:hypothetical protein
MNNYKRCSHGSLTKSKDLLNFFPKDLLKIQFFLYFIHQNDHSKLNKFLPARKNGKSWQFCDFPKH